MRIFLLITLFLGIALALETSALEERAKRERKKASRPKKFSGAGAFRAAKRPGDAPGDYKTGTGKANVKRAKDGLKRVPAEWLDSVGRRRRREFETLQQLRSRQSASDFFECTNSNPRPSPEDCDVVVDQVLNSGDDLIVSASSCLVFTFRTCQGFFCSLCQTLSTSTDFIGNQLDTVDALCIENGQSGTIVAEDPPQWDAGFTYAGAGLPFYDVC
ncbi:hypothetical protein QBC35DRAFT_268101 [Podospora australis]|uniref:Cyanovirin-N domain-containing protein n=1 Tax=Podospora australis TaxID=1536484 RepID=A0AAN6WRP1_9PEZI|nr:hypothetical protein QBC35DRAFT_268101 [Podospora australis]